MTAQKEACILNNCVCSETAYLYNLKYSVLDASIMYKSLRDFYNKIHPKVLVRLENKLYVVHTNIYVLNT